MIFIMSLIGIAFLGAVLSPFFWGTGGQLAAAASETSQDRLTQMQDAILRRYLADEDAAERGVIGKSTWQKRRVYLVNRYIDTTRRLDFLRAHAERERK